MHYCLIRRATAFALIVGLQPTVVSAQRSDSGDEIIDAMRGQGTISDLDKERIADWQRKEVASLAAAENKTEAFQSFRARMAAQFAHSGNSREFTRQFVVQAAKVAQEKFANRRADGAVARALARVLVDMGRAETIPGLVAGLDSANQSARFLCAKGLAAQGSVIAADQSVLPGVVRALREAGRKEANPVVLSRIYLALSHPGHAGVVFDAFLDLFDQRLDRRRGPAVVVDGAEIDAFEFFALSAVINALSKDQKAQLASRMAVFLRLDAERYDTELLKFGELTRLEYLLVLGEKILAQLVNSDKNGINKALEERGHANRKRVLKAAYGWVGNPRTKEKGTLNEPPWNVPIGAP